MGKFWSFTKNGGWVVLLAIFFFFAALTQFVLIPLLNGHLYHFVGNGKTVSSYQFNLTPCLVPKKQIIASGQYKGALEAFDHPRYITPRRVTQLNKKEVESGRFLLPLDTVIGVKIGGQSRAYPVRIMGWHDVANATVGGQPIAVTFDGWCNSAAVYSRVSGGKTLVFGYSGLEYNSNALLYDRQPKPAQESLWSQIQGRAITGPAAGARRKLKLLFCQIVSYGRWLKMHPHTLVLRRMPGMRAAYRKAPFDAYYFNPSTLHYPVQPQWNNPALPMKTNVLAIRLGTAWRVLPFPWLIKQAAGRKFFSIPIAGRSVGFRLGRKPLTLALHGAFRPPVMYSLLFAWYAQHPTVKITY